MMKLRPLLDIVVLRREDPEKVSAGGIHLVDETAEKEGCLRGEVLAVGPGRFDGERLIVPSVKVGDRIVMPRFSGTEVELGSEKYLIVRAGDIMAVVEP